MICKKIVCYLLFLSGNAEFTRWQGRISTIIQTENYIRIFPHKTSILGRDKLMKSFKVCMGIITKSHTDFSCCQKICAIIIFEDIFCMQNKSFKCSVFSLRYRIGNIFPYGSQKLLIRTRCIMIILEIFFD